MLRLPPAEVSFSKVIRVIDGPLSPTLCVSLYFYGRCDDCQSEEECTLRNVMQRWRDANLEVLDKSTLVDLL